MKIPNFSSDGKIVKKNKKKEIKKKPVGQTLRIGDRALNSTTLLSQEISAAQSWLYAQTDAVIHYLLLKLDLDWASSNPADKKLVVWMKSLPKGIFDAIDETFDNLREKLELELEQGESLTYEQRKLTRKSLEAIAAVLNGGNQGF